MSMEDAIMRDMGVNCYRASKITTMLNRLGQGDLNEGIMIVAYAGIPIYLISDYSLDQIYDTIIDSKKRGGESDQEIIIWLNSQPMESELRHQLVKPIKTAA